MESFGKLLKDAREAKQLSYDNVEAETKIMKLYLEALESEELDVFSGETYVLGFLRNYALYLNLDAEHLIQLYHAKKLQETPVPEGLLKIRKSRWFVFGIVMLCLVLAAGLGVLGWWGFTKWQENRVPETDIISIAPDIGKTYTLTADPVKMRIYEGDIIRIDTEEGELSMSVEKTLEVLSFRTPAGVQIVELGEELDIDIDGNGTGDVSVFLTDVSMKNDTLGAEVRMYAKNAEAGESTVDDSIIMSAATYGDAADQLVLIKSNRAFPFTVTASFRGSCLFRYQYDNEVENEDFYANGDKLVYTAKNSSRVWMSNANTVKIQVQGDGQTTDLAFGKAGQVLVEDIRWVKEADGVYKLVVLQVE